MTWSGRRACSMCSCGVMNTITQQPVVRVGRIAGQYAKPRSAHTEWAYGVEIPVYRGTW